MKNIQYFEILKRALIVSWRNKFLWVFGLFIFLGSIFSNIGLNINDYLSLDKAEKSAVLTDFIQKNSHFLSAIAPIFIAVVFIFFIFKFIGIAGIIKSTNNIGVYGQSTIKNISLEVKKYVWPLFLLEILTGLILALIIAVLITPVIYLYEAKEIIFFAISLSFACFIIIFLVIVAYYLRRYACFYVVLGNMKITAAFESAYALFIKNVKKSLIMGCVAIVINILAMVTVFVFSVIIIAVFAIFGALVYYLFAKAGAIFIFVFGVLVFGMLFLIFFSGYLFFMQAAWTLFFQEISLEKREEKRAALVLESSEKIPASETV